MILHGLVWMQPCRDNPFLDSHVLDAGNLNKHQLEPWAHSTLAELVTSDAGWECKTTRNALLFFVQLETGVLRKSDPLGRGIRPLLKSNHSRTDEDEELWEKIRCALWDHDMPRVLHRGISWHPYKTNSTMDYMTSNWVTRQHAQFLPMFNLTTTNHGFWKWGAQMWSGPTPTCEIRLPGFGWFTIQIPWWVESWQFVVIFGSRFINLSG